MHFDSSVILAFIISVVAMLKEAVRMSAAFSVREQVAICTVLMRSAYPQCISFPLMCISCPYAKPYPVGCEREV